MRTSFREVFEDAQQGRLWEADATSVTRLRTLERTLRKAVTRDMGEHSRAWELYNSNIWERQGLDDVEDSSCIMILNCPPPPGSERADTPNSRWCSDYLQSVMVVLHRKGLFPQDLIPISMNYRPLCPCLVAEARAVRILGGSKPLTCTHFAETRTKSCDRSLYGAFTTITAACARSAWLRINHVRITCSQSNLPSVDVDFSLSYLTM